MLIIYKFLYLKNSKKINLITKFCKFILLVINFQFIH